MVCQFIIYHPLSARKTSRGLNWVLDKCSIQELENVKQIFLIANLKRAWNSHWRIEVFMWFMSRSLEMFLIFEQDLIWWHSAYSMTTCCDAFDRGLIVNLIVFCDCVFRLRRLERIIKVDGGEIPESFDDLKMQIDDFRTKLEVSVLMVVLINICEQRLP